MTWQRYASYADAAYAALMTWYNPVNGRWDPPREIDLGFGWHSGLKWWQCANALNAVINYSMLRPVGNIQEMMATAFSMNRNTNFTFDPLSFSFGPFHNPKQTVYDDEAWWALAWLAAYDLVTRAGAVDSLNMAKSYLSMVETIFNDMSSQWTWKCGGGIFWDTPDYARSKHRPRYKNAIVNELFLTVAIRLYQRTKDDLYLTWANDEWNWFNMSDMQDTKTGLINDGLGSGPKSGTDICTNNGDTTWTYNQGVILGGLADMYLVTGDSEYLTKAWSLFRAVTDSALVDSASKSTPVDAAEGVLTEPGSGGDLTQFKGIFVRNLSYLYSVDPDPDGSHRPVYLTFVAANANSLWLNNRDGGNRFGYNWAGPFDSADASRQSSALDALVAAIRLDAL